MTTPSPFALSIPRRGPRCSLNQEVLNPGSEYYSVIEEDENGQIVRKDFCPSCWESTAKKECLSKAKSYWKSTVPPKHVEPPPNQNREIAAFDLLKLALNNSPEDDAEAFILSLYLARKRHLLLRQQLKQADGTIVTLYEVASTEEMLGVKKLPLSQLEVVKLQQRLAGKLKTTVN